MHEETMKHEFPQGEYAYFTSKLHKGLTRLFLNRSLNILFVIMTNGYFSLSFMICYVFSLNENKPN